jgi:hypothetical protein
MSRRRAERRWRLAFPARMRYGGERKEGVVSLFPHGTFTLPSPITPWGVTFSDGP